MNPTNIEVSVYHYGRTCVQWHYNGWRYHFWMTRGGPFEAESNALYKNPIEPSRDSRTLTLRANAITNAAMIEKVRVMVDADQLLAKASKAFEDEQVRVKKELDAELARDVERELAMTYFAELEKLAHERAPDHEVLQSIASMRVALRKKAGL